jgi:hypothetical protein
LTSRTDYPYLIELNMAIFVKYVEVLVSLLALLAGLSNQLKICPSLDSKCSATVTSSCVDVPVSTPVMIGSAVCINSAGDPNANGEISAEYTPISCNGYIEEIVDQTNCKNVGSGYFKLDSSGTTCNYYTGALCSGGGTPVAGCTTVGSDSAKYVAATNKLTYYSGTGCAVASKTLKTLTVNQCATINGRYFKASTALNFNFLGGLVTGVVGPVILAVALASF